MRTTKRTTGWDWCALFLGLSCLLCISLNLWSQTDKGSVSGRVVDSDGRAIQGAEIILDLGGTAGTSNQAGEFSIAGLIPGEYRLSVSYAGFLTSSTSVAVAAGMTAQTGVVMKV